MQLYHFAFSPEMNKRSCCSTFCPAFGVVSAPNFGHSIKCVLVSHCYFNLHFPDGIRCGVSFHMLICHLYIFLGECLLRSLTYFLIGLFVFLLLSFKCSLNILYNSPLSDVSFANIFSQSVACLILLTVSFANQKFLISRKSCL